MKQLVRHTIGQYSMIPPGTRVLCGLSGGADSVSLVLCLQELGYDICACHYASSKLGKYTIVISSHTSTKGLS